MCFQRQSVRLALSMSMKRVVAVLLLGVLLQGEATTTTQEDQPDQSRLLQTEVVLRSGVACPDSGKRTNNARSTAGAASIGALNAVAVIIAVHGLKHWRRAPVVDDFASKSEARIALKADANAANNSTIEDDKDQAGVENLDVTPNVKQEGSDVGSFLISWDCFQ
mmetsp:Transcript_23026/g.52755  ORF Transcript_23026/g.52755 Transcript_23026/m.52755 type:complete len:165 (+) Transcript_23026:151-645(+)|eukprot:CAMPEP_0197916650 /NCGR_PEP_ID=MMETSP1439-20131203/82357_1 /TAXON_ID=66791 /ORGANISM="Gonyaulax spinifera, Strain CCMP409" /LENGTH=164 /DNA_ID=CAMNT_0043538687 /DNA_START=132 /DNA_END=626 /DNA_ORIENTATION=+